MKDVIEKCKKMYNKEKPLKIEWVIAILIALVMLVMFYYVDFKSLTVWSANILDCVAKGDITEYYTYTAQNIYHVPHRYVSGTLYSLIVWAIWNIPAWIIQHFFGKPIISNAFLMLWSKLFLVVALAITLIFTYKICKILFKDKNKSLWITFLALTFAFTYIGVFYAGQNDILICMCAILGLYFLLKDKNILFYVFSALAISVKYFYLIPYIPIILYLEKNIFKIILKVGIGVAPIVIFKFLVRNFPLYAESEASNHTTQITDGFLKSGIIGAEGQTISFFIVVYVVLCVLAYLKKPKDTETRNNYIFYFSVVPIMLMLMFSTYYEFYRPILLVPMLMILYGFKPEIFRINIILDTLFSFFMLLYNFAGGTASKWLFASDKSMNGTLITKMLKIKSVNSVSPAKEITRILGENAELVKNLSISIMFAIIAIMIVINYPEVNVNKEERENPKKPERWIIWLRTLMLVPILIYLLISI